MFNLYDVVCKTENGLKVVTVFAVSHTDAMELVERCGLGFAKQACFHDGNGEDCVEQVEIA